MQKEKTIEEVRNNMRCLELIFEKALRNFYEETGVAVKGEFGYKEIEVESKSGTKENRISRFIVNLKAEL